MDRASKSSFHGSGNLRCISTPSEKGAICSAECAINALIWQYSKECSQFWMVILRKQPHSTPKCFAWPSSLYLLPQSKMQSPETLPPPRSASEKAFPKGPFENPNQECLFPWDCSHLQRRCIHYPERKQLPVLFLALQFLFQYQSNLWVTDTEIPDSLQLFRFESESSKPVRSMHVAWET